MPARHAAAFAAALVTVAVALFLLNGWNAYHPTDDGFVLAYSWRVLHGEVPYRDFIFVRTPLTPYLHTLELLLPDGWAIQAGRLAFYLELAAAGASLAAAAAWRAGARASARSVAVGLVVYLFAVHNFPPMPWATVDAALLASAGATALLFSLDAPPRRRLALLAAASALIALSALAKQTFAPLALLLVVWGATAAARERSAAALLATVLPGALVAAAAVSLLALAGALSEAAYQILAPAGLEPSAAIPWSGDIVDVAVRPYLLALDPVALVGLGAAFALASRPERGRVARPASLVVLAVLTALAIESQFDVWRAGRHLWWMLAGLLAGTGLRGTREDRAAALGLGAVLAIGWCASMSFAYQTPLLGIAGAGVFLGRALSRVVWPAGAVAIALTAGIVAGSVLTLQLDRPYRDVPRAEQVADLGAVYPRFGHLYTNATNVARFAELRDLTVRYAIARGRPFVVLPEYPLIQYLSGTRSVLSVDWLEPQEYLGREARVISELRSRRPTVLIAREPDVTIGAAAGPPAPCGDPPQGQAIVRLVASEWVLEAEGRYFCVYAPP